MNKLSLAIAAGIRLSLKQPIMFTIGSKDLQSKARAGFIRAAHGTVSTPVFMPVGTTGAVKAVHMHELMEDIDSEIILGNTYHLYLRPGKKVLEAAGGLHRFSGWNRPILTDSGGYQVFSLAATRKLTQEGVTFQSHIDGSRHLFTPEQVIDIQRSIGADIIMALDECAPYPCTESYALRSMELTHQWLRRCMDHHRNRPPLYGYGQNLFPIVQGSIFPELRERSAAVIAEWNAPGNAIGGLSVGEPAEEMYRMTEIVCHILPEDKPRYLMGVGTPANILESIALGIDMFDCVIPTRNARHGLLYTWQGMINIKNEKWKDDFSPLDPDGKIRIDHTCSRAYLRHLFAAGESLAGMIASLHNLGFYKNLLDEARTHIIQGDFRSWKEKVTGKLDNKL